MNYTVEISLVFKRNMYGSLTFFFLNYDLGLQSLKIISLISNMLSKPEYPCVNHLAIHKQKILACLICGPCETRNIALLITHLHVILRLLILTLNFN